MDLTDITINKYDVASATVAQLMTWCGIKEMAQRGIYIKSGRFCIFNLGRLT